MNRSESIATDLSRTAAALHSTWPPSARPALIPLDLDLPDMHSSELRPPTRQASHPGDPGDRPQHRRDTPPARTTTRRQRDRLPQRTAAVSRPSRRPRLDTGQPRSAAALGSTSVEGGPPGSRTLSMRASWISGPWNTASPSGATSGLIVTRPDLPYLHPAGLRSKGVLKVSTKRRPRLHGLPTAGASGSQNRPVDARDVRGLNWHGSASFLARSRASGRTAAACSMAHVRPGRETPLPHRGIPDDLPVALWKGPSGSCGCSTARAFQQG
jgi:hypothetical protein